MMRQIATMAAIAVSVAGVMLTRDVVAAGAAKPVPVGASPHGQSYAEWAAEWWQWALETPVGENPFVTGQCAIQPDTHVAFLIGALGGGSLESECTVPSGTSLFFPIANTFYGAGLTDPEDMRTEEYVRSQVTCAATVLEMSVLIDGQHVLNPEDYFEESQLFEVAFPDEDALFELNGLVLDPSVDAGHYLFLPPLTPGEHTIEWTATTGCGTQDISWIVNVESGRRR
jgi:hypothetical protein